MFEGPGLVEIDAGIFRAAGFKDQTFLYFEAAIAGKSRRFFHRRGGFNRLPVPHQHDKTPCKASANAARSASVLISVEAARMRSSNPLPGKSRETGTPPRTPICRHALDRLRRIAGNPDREFIEKCLVQHRDAGDRREPVAKRDRIGMIDPGETPQTRVAKQGQINREGKAREAGIGADIRRRLVAPDMLFARRKGQDEGAAAGSIDRFAAETSRHLAQIFGLRREKPDIGTAEIQAIADRLTLARDNVGAHCARRLHEAKRNSFGEHRDEQCALGPAQRGGSGKIAEIAEEIRVLHHDAGGFFINASVKSFRREDVGREHQGLISRPSPHRCVWSRHNADADRRRRWPCAVS